MTNASNSSFATSGATAAEAHAPGGEPALSVAAQRVLADIDAMPENDLSPLYRDADKVATTVLAAYRLFAPLLPQLAGMPGFDVERARKLEDYAAGLLYWNAGASYAVPARPELVALSERAVALREQTLLDLKVLVRHGVLPGELLEEFGGTTGYLKVAHDLIAIARLVHERWSSFGGKTMITLEAMDEAMRLGTEIVRGVGDRDLAKVEAARDVVRRNKAFTLVVRTYEEVRTAIAYLRRVEGDAEKFAPTLAPVTRRKGRSGEDEEAVAESASPAVADSGLLGPQHTSLLVPDDGAPS